MPKKDNSHKSSKDKAHGDLKRASGKENSSKKTPTSTCKLLIVESPTKAKTIKNYLGQGFEVIASKGHIKDLPEDRLGVSLDNNFEPEIVILPGKKPIVKEIQQKAALSDEIYIGSDPDREGEAIAQHIKEEIEKKVGDKPIKRALFYEITRDEILRAISNAGDIDPNKVESQKARRILDRLVGYLVSPLLWKTIKKGLSAGRVQTVALRLICEREKERQNFKKERFFIVKINLSKDGQEFWATLKAEKVITDEEQAKELIKNLKGQNVQVAKFEKKILKIKPHPPLKTSTLQQEASRRFKFTPGKTMKIAQRLYEGVDVDGRSIGLITYMRTDSLRLSEKAISLIRKEIEKNFGKDFLPPSPINHETKNKMVQGAHEAIRPTKPDLHPDYLKDKIDNELYKIYNLIWRRALASQSNYAEEELKEATINFGDLSFLARGKRLIFEGFYKILNEIPEYEDIPDLKPGEILSIKNAKYEIRETEPPPQYTEASLIRTMEHLGIGRPSTYAPTLETLYEREYIKKEKGYIVPTELGMKVNDLLIPRFKEIFEIKFTAKMEEMLDKIESGEKTSIDVLREFYDQFQKELKNFQDQIKTIREEIQKTEKICPLCGAPLLRKWSKFGAFLACSRYPECRYTIPADSETQDNIRCPICDKPMVLITGKKGKYFRCSDYPKCKGIRPYSIGIKCPECNGEIVEKRSTNGKVFYGCSRYPECKLLLPSLPIEIQCEKCGYPIMIEAKNKRYLKCPKCGATLKVKKEDPNEKSTDI
ncbi:MAG: type I DNA topoisomerase [candidate division WOR-3 bacterium]